MAAAPALEPVPVVAPNPYPVPKIDTSDPGIALFLKLKKQFGLYSGEEFKGYARKLPAADHLVEGLLPRRSVNILVGDSGLGKTPLGYQLALAVAAGAPFLGLPTRPAKVLLVDYENAPWDSLRMLEQQRKHLGLAAYPSPNFLFWPMDYEPPPGGMEQVIGQLAPDLVILDSLRSFSPEMERDNTAAIGQIKRLRQIAARSQTALLLIHHVRKQPFRDTHSLGDGPALDWLRRTAGARALVNQTDVRLGLAPAGRKDAGEDGDLVLHGHFRTRGEVGPFLLRRKRDADGEPLGYERFAAAPSLLENTDHEAAFHRLPEFFSFKEARLIYGKQDAATNFFLQKLVRLGLLHKRRPGQYRKFENAQKSGVEQ